MCLSWSLAALVASLLFILPANGFLMGRPLGIFNFISGLYRHYYARLNAAQQLAALYNAQNTPPVQRRNSMALLRVADAQ